MSDHPTRQPGHGDGEPAENPEGELPGGLGAMLGGLDLGSLFGAASEMLAAQQSNANVEITGRAGGGAVQIRVSGGGEFLGVRIAPELIDPQDVALLEDTLLAALRDAMDQVQQLQRGSLGGLGGLGGLDALAGMSELFGAPGTASSNEATALPGGDEIDGDRKP